MAECVSSRVDADYRAGHVEISTCSADIRNEMRFPRAPFATDEQRSDSAPLAQLDDAFQDEVSNAVVANRQRFYLLTRDNPAAEAPD